MPVRINFSGSNAQLICNRKSSTKSIAYFIFDTRATDSYFSQLLLLQLLFLLFLLLLLMGISSNSSNKRSNVKFPITNIPANRNGTVTNSYAWSMKVLSGDRYAKIALKLWKISISLNLFIVIRSDPKSNTFISEHRWNCNQTNDIKLSTAQSALD